LRHTPVLAESARDLLLTGREGLYVDGTVGTGGHAEKILGSSGEGVRLLGIDRDPRAIEEAGRRLAGFGERATLLQGDFSDIGKHLAGRACEGFLLDLGISSLQIEDGDRGIGYMGDGPLDMSMGPGSRDVVPLLETAGEDELAGILREFGEERRSRRVAREIVRRRAGGRMETVAELRKAVAAAVPPHRLVPSLARVFQALRIWSNRELEALDSFLPQAVGHLAPGGRMVVISYHSLEDRIVKRFFRDEEKGCVCPADLPECACGRSPSLRVLTRKPVRPDAEEIASNPRARSARLRAAERLQS